MKDRRVVKNPHILNISPPLNMSAAWFAPHVGEFTKFILIHSSSSAAYTMAKYGMSMCVLGMAEELRASNIAVNALWPRTVIWTAAMRHVAGDAVAKQCRHATIVADAAYAVLGRDSRSYTGQFAIDEQVLREEGVVDFEPYAVQPGHRLMDDYFLGERRPVLK